jgi:pSer/pThr/pTyr-binding forkhead associated (FHA) protein
VLDLKSTNGTFVNDKRVEKATLATGDRLRVGRVELTVERQSRAQG